jgi:hypothetical protein
VYRTIIREVDEGLILKIDFMHANNPTEVTLVSVGM